jgi:hypothetical protein
MTRLISSSMDLFPASPSLAGFASLRGPSEVWKALNQGNVLTLPDGPW